MIERLAASGLRISSGLRIASSLFATSLIVLAVLAAPLTISAQRTIHVPADVPTIQAGLYAANPGDTVLVSPGTYFEHLTFGSKAVTLMSVAGPATTIIDGSVSGPVVTLGTPLAMPSVLDGFTIQNGSPSQIQPISTSGGVTIQGSATVQNNIIQNNKSCGIDIATPGIDIVRANHILQNGVGSAGPGVSGCPLDGTGIDDLLSGLSTFTNPTVTISGNVIELNAGAAISGDFEAQSLAVMGNTLRNNSGSGMTITAISGSAVVADNLVYGNATLGISAHYYSPSTLSLVNNTLYADGGTASTTATELEVIGAGVVVADNVIVHTAAASKPMLLCTLDGGSPLPSVFDHNDILNTTGAVGNSGCAMTGFGNISADPRFSNAANGDFHLLIASPAIDTGNTSAPGLPATDLDNNPRIADATGKGYPIVDMGAYEFVGRQELSPTLASLTPSTATPPVCSSFSLTAVLTSPALAVPSGRVSLYEDFATSPYATATLDATGQATFVASTTTVGLHGFYVTYNGSVPFTPAVSVVAYVSTQGSGSTSCSSISSATLTGTPNPVADTASLLLTAQLSATTGTPSGSVAFSEGTRVFGTAPLSSTGSATLSLPLLLAGTHTLTVGYPATGIFTATSATTQVVVTGGNPSVTTLTSSLNPAPYGQPITLTATVASPTGVLAQGVVQLSDTSASPATVLATQNIVFAANPPSFSVVLSNLGVGTHTLVATFTPTSADVSGSSAQLAQVITGVAGAISMTASPSTAYVGQAVALSASVVGSAVPPTGSVTFFDGAATLGVGTLDATGSTTYTATTLTAGVHVLKAVYAGSQGYSASTSPVVVETILASPTGTTLTTSLNPAVSYQIVAITAQVVSLTPVQLAAQPCSPSCTVMLTFTGSTFAPPAASYPVPANGQVSVRVALPAGSYTVAASFSGSSAFNPSSATSISQIVVPVATTLSLSATPNPANAGQTVTLAATLAAPASTAVPSGSITFLDTGVPIGSTGFGNVPTANSITASLPTNTLAPGVHTITATYPGDANYLASASVPVTVTVFANDFTVTPNQPALTVQAQHHVTTTLTLASQGNFADNIRLTCAPGPPFASCTFTPMYATLAAGGTTQVSLYIDTDAIIGYASNRPSSSPASKPYAALALLILPGLLLARQRPRLHRSACTLAIASLAMIAALTGCSGKYPGNTPPGTYTITVIASAFSTPTTHLAPITLTVTP